MNYEYVIVYFDDNSHPTLEETKEYGIYQTNGNEIRCYFQVMNDQKTSYKTDGWFSVAPEMKKYLQKIDEEEMFLLSI